MKNQTMDSRSTGTDPSQQEESRAGRPSSKYLVGSAVVVFLIDLWFQRGGFPITPTYPDWYLVVLPELLGFLGVMAVLAYIIARITRAVADRPSAKQFDYFAITYLVMAVLFFVPIFFG